MEIMYGIVSDIVIIMGMVWTLNSIVSPGILSCKSFNFVKVAGVFGMCWKGGGLRPPLSHIYDFTIYFFKTLSSFILGHIIKWRHQMSTSWLLKNHISGTFRKSLNRQLIYGKSCLILQSRTGNKLVLE